MGGAFLHPVRILSTAKLNSRTPNTRVRVFARMRLQILSVDGTLGAPHPGFPVRLGEPNELLAAFLKESRIRDDR